MRTVYRFTHWRFVQMLYAKHAFDQAARSWPAGRPASSPATSK
jgi:hypothetical protein